MSQTIPLGELVDIRGGGTPSRGITEYWDGPVPWATVKDFKSTCLDRTLESITEVGVANSATNVIPAGSVIVPTRMAVGKAAINKVDLAINQDLKAILPRGEIDTRFLLHFLLSKASFLEGRAQGATVKGIKLDLLRSLEFPKLSLEEQRRIAAILDKADAIRRKREQALALADDLLKSTFLEMFFSPSYSWPTVPLRSVARLINGDRSSRYPSGKEIVDSGVLFLNTKNIDGSKLNFDNPAFITQAKFDSLTQGKLARHDLVITLRGSIGQCAIFDSEFETGFINAQLMIIRPSEKVLPSYLHRLILHPIIQNKLLNQKSGSAVPQLTGKQIGDLEIPLPNLAAQTRFAEFASSTARLEEKLTSAILESRNSFASLSQRAFRGEL